MADISTITLDDGNTYDIKDAVARAGSSGVERALGGDYITNIPYNSFEGGGILCYTATETSIFTVTYAQFRNLSAYKATHCYMRFALLDTNNQVIGSYSVPFDSVNASYNSIKYNEDINVSIPLNPGYSIKVRVICTVTGTTSSITGLMRYRVASAPYTLLDVIYYADSQPQLGRSRYGSLSYRTIIYTASEPCLFKFDDVQLDTNSTNIHVNVGLFSPTDVCVLDLEVAWYSSGNIITLPDYPMPLDDGWKIAVLHRSSATTEVNSSAKVFAHVYK